MAVRPYASVTERAAYAAVRVSSLVIIVFLVAPILVIFPLSFTSGDFLSYPLPGLSLRWYQDFFTSPVWLNAAKTSFLLAGCTTVLATALGTPAALGLSRPDFRYRAVVTGVIITPMIVPIIIVAVATFFFYARLGLAGTFVGLVLAHTALALPFVVIPVTATLQGFDQTLVRAAFASGARPMAAFWLVTCPLILPGIVTGMIFAFITSFDEIVVVIFLGSPELRTLPRQIWSGVKETISPTITVAAVVLVLASVSLMIIVEILRRRSARLGAGKGNEQGRT
jgi:putative spermidine/putrescine transport system permease protein